MAGSVIQGTGTVKFEDGFWIGNWLKAHNGLQRVGTIPRVLPGVLCTHKLLQGQNNFNMLKFALLPGVEPGAGFDH